MIISEKNYYKTLLEYLLLTDFGIENPKSDKFERNRNNLSRDGAFWGFSVCCRWLEHQKIVKSPSISSYYLKHIVEKWAKDYISNGQLIAAIFFLGIPYKEFYNNPNINVGISKKFVPCPLLTENIDYGGGL